MHGRISSLTEPRVRRTRSQSTWSGKKPEATIVLSPRIAERCEFAELMGFCIDKIDLSHDETPIFTV
jgi:acetylornithine aminotransferase